MDREKVKEILKVVVDFYGKRVIGDDPVQWVNNWFLVLKDSDFDEVNENLIRYIKTNEFAPKPANLLSFKEYRISIPGVEETDEYIEKMRSFKTELSKEEIDSHLDNIRKILFKPRLEEDYE